MFKEIVERIMGVPGEVVNMIQREAPEVDEARAALVKKKIQEIQESKAHHDPVFRRMRRDMELARKGHEWDSEEEYVANMILRHLKNQVSSLYAKNPTAEAKRRPRMDFKVWDGNQESLSAALAGAQFGDPNALALLQDILEGMERRDMLDRLGETLEILFHYFLNEGQPRFKLQAKQMVRRANTTGVGYIKIGFQRKMAKSPELEGRIRDATDRLAATEALVADQIDEIQDESSADSERLRLLLGQLQGENDTVLREGLVFSFPKSTNLIVDRDCYQLNGFLGAKFVAEEFLLTREQVKEIYKIDLGTGYTHYSPGNHLVHHEKDGKGLAMVWERYDINDGMVYTVCDGYPDFMLEPSPPVVRLERFWPYFVLTFNDIEDEKEIYPPSDVHLLRHMQLEHNRAREGLRQHRQHAKPFSVAAAGSFDGDGDKEKIRARVPHEIVELQGLRPEDDIKKKVQDWPNNPIDPNLYHTNHLFDDAGRVVGAHEGNIADSESATEASLIESGRIKPLASNADDLDEMLTDLARSSSQVLLVNLSYETAVEIAGPGAVWPQFSSEDLAKEIGLEIRAGSSGKPNREQNLANLERATPLLIQAPGVNPNWLVRTIVEAIDDKIDLTEAITEGLPSIIAMNKMSTLTEGATGDPNRNPGAQGEQGGDNAQAGPDVAGGPQPAFPPPSSI